MNNKKCKTKEEISSWLDRYLIDDYTINDDLTVDVNNEVNLRAKGLMYLPVNFNNVRDNFVCDQNNFINLDGCPKYVGGSFDGSKNKLISLKGCPEKVMKMFDVSSNKLMVLDFFPKEIGYISDISYNNISSFIGVNSVIKGDFYCAYTNIKNLDSLVMDIGGKLYFNGLEIDGSERVAGELFKLDEKILKTYIEANQLNVLLFNNSDNKKNIKKI